MGNVQPRLATGKAVSRKPISITSDDKIEQLKKVNLKKRTEAKMNWGVKAYNEWRNERLENFIKRCWHLLC